MLGIRLNSGQLELELCLSLAKCTKAEGETTVKSNSVLPLARKANTLNCKQVMVVARIKTYYSVLVRREDFLPWPRILS